VIQLNIKLAQNSDNIDEFKYALLLKVTAVRCNGVMCIVAIVINLLLYMNLILENYIIAIMACCAANRHKMQQDIKCQ